MIQNSPAGATVDRSSLNATVGRVAAVATALLLVAFLVLSVSRAAFTASTANENNFVTTDGVVTLTDNDADVAMFQLTDATPATETTQCIHVQYAGDFTSGDVKMYATVGAQSTLADLAPYLDVEVDAIEIPDASFDPLDVGLTCAAFDLATLPVTGGTPTNVYSGTLGDFPSDYADGATAFDGEASTYAFQITVQVQDDPEAAQARADWSFTWETQTA